MKIFKLKYLILKFFYSILKILSKLTLDIIYKDFRVMKIILKKYFKVISSYKNYLLILIIVFIFSQLEADTIIKKQGSKQSLIKASK